ncbi:hypothetical protein [Streptomyces sp. NPDC090112]|uniref:hypothetical protein n=1 Tax=Streptomyces sp. NPDC090112 TaxID=3365949 RepID=UPI00382BDEA1
MGGEDEDSLEDVIAGILADSLVHPEQVGAEHILTATARVSLQRAIDLVALAGEGDDDAEPGALAELVSFCARATAYWSDHTAEGSRGDGAEFFSWLGDIEDDDDFLDRLQEEVTNWEQPTLAATAQDDSDQWESFGLAGALPSRVVRAVHRLRALNVTVRTRPLAAGVRRWGARPAARLMGDVMSYLTGRGSVAAPGPIVELVASSLAEAARDATMRGEPLVVVAHSMGGNIVHDVLTHFRTDIDVDLLVTVGTQVGLFEELKLFASSDPKLPTREQLKVPALPNVDRWLNVLDRSDPLAFAAGPVFEGAEDLIFSTGEWWAHGAYLTSCDFHARLAHRVRKSACELVPL